MYDVWQTVWFFFCAANWSTWMYDSRFMSYSPFRIQFVLWFQEVFGWYCLFHCVRLFVKEINKWMGWIIIIIIWIGVQFRALPPASTAASVAYCKIPRFPKRSYFGRQVPVASTTRGSPLAARGGTMGEKWCLGYAPRVLLHAANLRYGTDNFTSLTCWGFLSPFKNPTASAGFEPTNVGIRGQHATFAPPKPLY